MSGNENIGFEEGLRKHLWKCELEYRAKVMPGGSCVQWLAPMCGSVEQIAAFLRELGFKIQCIVDEETSFGNYHRWVVTTSGVIVYANSEGLEGLVARSAGYPRKRGAQWQSGKR